MGDKAKHKKRGKEERIAFRIETEIKEILEDMADSYNLTLSMFIRHIITRFYMEFLMGHFQKPFTQLREEFMEFAKRIEMQDISQSPQPEQSFQRESETKS